MACPVDVTERERERGEERLGEEQEKKNSARRDTQPFLLFNMIRRCYSTDEQCYADGLTGDGCEGEAERVPAFNVDQDCDNM